MTCCLDSTRLRELCLLALRKHTLYLRGQNSKVLFELVDYVWLEAAIAVDCNCKFVLYCRLKMNYRHAVKLHKYRLFFNFRHLSALQLGVIPGGRECG